jgi:serine/threonine protein kinase
VGEYTLLSRIGEGGMGVVHLAQKPGGDRVALKVLRPHIIGDDEARARLAREVSSLRRIQSHRVAAIVDADPWGEIPFVATRYVPGLSLHEHIRDESAIVGPDLAWFGLCLAEALREVHAVGVLHRDVKPSNVLLEGRTPILIDFGLARVADDPRLTHTGWLLGTPGYLAPEILQGQNASAASDVHSWAATVAFAGTGRPPFGRGPSIAIMDRVRRGEHDIDGLPDDVRAAVHASLHPSPGRRPSLATLIEAMTAVAERKEPRAGAAAEPPMTVPLAIAAAAQIDEMPTVVGAGVDAEAPTRNEPSWVEQAMAAPVPATLPATQPGPPPFAAELPTRQADIQPMPGVAPARQPYRTPPPRQFPPPPNRAYPPPPPAPVPTVVKLRRAVLLIGGLAVGAAACAAAPYAAITLMTLAVWLLRAGSLAFGRLGVKRRARGPKWHDATGLVLSLPWWTLMAIPGALILLFWSGGLAVSAGLLCYAVTAPLPLALAVTGAVFVVATWFGPGGSRVRGPVRRVVEPVSSEVAPWAVATALVAALALALALASGDGINWSPDDTGPLNKGSFLRGAVNR